MLSVELDETGWNVTDRVGVWIYLWIHMVGLRWETDVFGERVFVKAGADQP